MSATYCGQCGKPTPAGSIHTCSPQQHREWVTYEVQALMYDDEDGDYWSTWAIADSADEVRAEKAEQATAWPRIQFRAVRTRHTEEVIG